MLRLNSKLICIVLTLSLAGCSGFKDKALSENRVGDAGTVAATSGMKVQTTPKQVVATPSASPAQNRDKTPIVTLKGSNRKDKPFTKKNHLVLPCGKIYSIGYGSFGERQGKSIDDEKLAQELIGLIEEGIVVKGPLTKHSGVSLGMDFGDEKAISLYPTMDGQYISVLFHGMPWVDVDSIDIKAPKLRKKMHEIAGWQYYDIAGLKGVKRIVMTKGDNVVTLDNPGEIEPIVAELRKGTYCEPSKCPFDNNSIEFYCGDKIVCAVLAGDGCPAILINRNEYDISKDVAKKLRDIMGFGY
ncbi:MAG: hypothetical protein N3B21_08255 [Clostridia bacterium]|nr:hypothetical protein [Clostridia bacterium]